MRGRTVGILFVFAAQAQVQDKHFSKLVGRMSKGMHLHDWNLNLNNTTLGKPGHFCIGRSAPVAAGRKSAFPNPWSHVSRFDVVPPPCSQKFRSQASHFWYPVRKTMVQMRNEKLAMPGTSFAMSNGADENLAQPDSAGTAEKNMESSKKKKSGTSKKKGKAMNPNPESTRAGPSPSPPSLNATGSSAPSPEVPVGSAVASPAAASPSPTAHATGSSAPNPELHEGSAVVSPTLMASDRLNQAQNKTLASFDGSLTLTPWRWETINDPVMGGQSSSAFRVAFSEGIWNGQVRSVPFLNAPGFCTVQAPGLSTSAAYPDLSTADGILVRARQIIPSGISRFNVQIRTKGAKSFLQQQGVYTADFSMAYDSQNNIQNHFLPWSAFKCTYLGEPVSWCPDISTQLGEVTNIGLGTSYPGEAGTFQVGITSLSAVQVGSTLIRSNGAATSRELQASTKIAVIGAGGATGLECVRRLLAQGKSVRCVVRDPQKYAGRFGSAEVVQGSVTDEASMEAALEGTSGVIFAASASSPFGPGGPSEVDYMGVGKVAQAAKANGVNKFVLVSSRLVDPVNRLNPIRVLLNNVNSIMDYKFRGEEALRSSGLDQYVIVRPGGLAGGEGRTTDTQPGAQYLVSGAAEADLGGSGGSIHRADVAAVVCEALTCPDAACKTIEIVARAPNQGEPTIEQQLACVFEAIPQDRKTLSGSSV